MLLYNIRCLCVRVCACVCECVCMRVCALPWLSSDKTKTPDTMWIFVSSSAPHVRTMDLTLLPSLLYLLCSSSLVLLRVAHRGTHNQSHSHLCVWSVGGSQADTHRYRGRPPVTHLYQTCDWLLGYYVCNQWPAVQQADRGLRKQTFNAEPSQEIQTPGILGRQRDTQPWHYVWGITRERQQVGAQLRITNNDSGEN